MKVQSQPPLPPSPNRTPRRTPQPGEDLSGLPEYGPDIPPDTAFVRRTKITGQVVGAAGYGLFKGFSFGVLGGGAGFLVGTAVQSLVGSSLGGGLRAGFAAAGGLTGVGLGLYDGISKGWEAGGQKGRELGRKWSGMPTGG